MTKYLVRITLGILLLFIIAATGVYWFLSQSLPKLNGTVSASVTNKVTATRDEQGTAQLTGKSRADVSYALGFLHGQERFFQMDLLRRNSAGELAELFGKLALGHDRNIRVHQFRKRVERYLKALTPQQQEILKQYTLGVNHGLSQLGAKPFEYALLQVTPARWQPEDSLLVMYSMYMDLQQQYGGREATLGLLNDLLPADMYSFITPEGSIWDAALDNSSYSENPIPHSAFSNATKLAKALDIKEFNLFPDPQEGFKGSNNWAVSGQVSTTGSAIVADDMHLGIGVPNIWFRTSMRYQHQGGEIKLDGVSLPGAPAIVVGTNHQVAWGFTNSYGDWSDLIKLVVNEDATKYLTPEGYKPFVHEQELIAVKNQASVTEPIQLTQWGPVIGKDHNGNLIAMRWVAHDREGLNFNLLNMEQTQDVSEAIAIAHTAGIPAQNIVLGDKQGNIAWTIAGAIPKKFGLDNTGSFGWAIPHDWSNGKIGWSGYLNSEDYPVILNPENHRIWTGNSRVVGAQNYQKVGNGGYALGARSQQIRDNLMNTKQFSEQDLLDIQNDDRAVFLSRWQTFLNNRVFTDNFVTANNYQELKSHLAQWQARAAIDSVGYLYVRQFRINFRDRLFEPLETLIKQNSKQALRARISTIRAQIETPMWQLINEQPNHLIPEGYKTWQAFSEQIAIETHEQLIKDFGSISAATWGAHNTTKIQHPLSKAIPALSWLLDMPSEPVHGDTYMPRVQGKDFGSSQRMVISPGHEQQAIFHVPSSQSGHPLSPYYGKGHNDWVKGVPSALLPGVEKYKLEFLPK